MSNQSKQPDLVAVKGVASATKLQAMYYAILRRERKLHGAAPTTVEALMYSLRERGPAALLEPDCRRRLGELNERETKAVAVRLQKLNPEIAAAWNAEQIKALLKVKTQL